MPRSSRAPGPSPSATTTDGSLAEWRARRSELVAACAERWSLALGPPYRGPHLSFTAPATTARGDAVVLKLQYPHREVVYEAEALRRWDGDGAIRLLDAAPEHHALLLERAEPGDALATIGPDALDVLVGLLPRLWVPAGAPFDHLRDEAARWCAHLQDPDRIAGLEPTLVDHAVGVLRELGPTVSGAVLLHQDLHGANVLRAEREPWLVIDPKPLTGEREFSAAPIVRSAELGHSRAAVLRRLDRLCAELGLDRDRARGWTVGQTMAWAADADPAIVARHQQVVRWLLDR
jgi:streptomycin 6-kinase